MTVPLLLADTAPPAWLRDAGADWAPGTLQRDAFYATVERLAALPGFIGMARQAARAVLDFLADTPMATRVVRDMPMYCSSFSSSFSCYRSLVKIRCGHCVGGCHIPCNTFPMLPHNLY